MLARTKGTKYYTITIPDSNKIQRPYGTRVATKEEVEERLEQAKKEQYFLHLIQVSYYIQSGIDANEAADHQWSKDAEQWLSELD
ncbi:hypothetical protein [Hymenobacter persicinus]|uniref:Uncharacterized protein n=1 Tax=Hymenobacter persicinus TaxID=2025506 RepID=A0A4Q5LD96_9BACT|nr:hypothetical protein [Hymenobacter persicinus]RYU81260.1 hypothetical protein EWM57_06700 [Hymenobacter persicinus]